MIKFCPLASGSKGNSIFLASKNTKILIDAGLSYKELLIRLSEINIDINQIDAILVTHEHMDHIEALKMIAQKEDILILSNSQTAKGIYNNLHIFTNFKIFTTDEPFEFKDLVVHPFSIQHDTLDPVGFIIKIDNIKIGICTDLGFVTTLVKKQLQDCDYLYVEANHDVNMLYASLRPQSLKKRIASRQGHLSNEECINLLEEIITPKLKHIYLAHLSAECNNKELVKKTVEEFLIKKKNVSTKISIAHQEKISEIICF